MLFFHQTVEEYLDHFLQALYARNRAYFPSRKRTEAAIASFALKPEDCFRRLTDIVRLGSEGSTIPRAVQEMRALCEELKRL